MVTRYDPVSLSSFLSQVDRPNLTVEFTSHFIQIVCNKYLINYQPLFPFVYKLCLYSRLLVFIALCFCTSVAVPFPLVVVFVSIQKNVVFILTHGF